MKAVASVAFVAVAQVSKILLGLVLIKLIAVYVGVDGLGKLGNLMSLMTMLMVLAGGGIVNGIIKYTAQYQNQQKNLLMFVSSASAYSMFFSTVIFVILLFFAGKIAGVVFTSEGYTWVIYVAAVAQFAFAFSNLVTGVANGHKNTKVYASIQIIGNAITILIVWFAIRYFGEAGAAVSIAIGSALMALPAFIVFYRSSFWKKVRLKKYFKANEARNLSGFTLMLIVSAIAFPAMEFFIRGMIIENSGYSDAGLWQALIKLSSVYVGFFGLFLAYYFIPTVSPLTDARTIKILTFKYMAVVVLIFMIGATLLVSLAGVFLPLLLSKEFLALKPFLIYQLVGDLFKIAAFVIGFVFVAKASVKIYIAAEIFQSLTFIGLAYIFYQDGFELISIMYAYILTYMMYFIVSLIVFLAKARWS